MSYIDELEEDVVFEGSELHKTLLQMGFTDFETVSIEQTKVNKLGNLKENKSSNKLGFYKKFQYLYNQLTQNKQLHREIILTILSLEPLLDDHAYNIQNLISEQKYCFWKKVYEWIPIMGTSVVTITSVITKQEKFLTILLGSFTSLCIYKKYMKRSSVHNLNILIKLQNALHNNIKKCLKILRNDFRIKKDPQKSGNSFLEFRRNQLKFLMPLMSSLIKSLEHISLLNYKASKKIYSLLPESKCSENLLTTFDDQSFVIQGEVTYDNLKCLYYTYLLTQSEMLQLLAIAYSEGSHNLGTKFPEYKLNYIVTHLIQPVKNHNDRLSMILKDYNAYDIKLIRRKFHGPNSKWQDIYLQLDISSQKLQTLYLIISSILNSIDNQNEENINDDDLIHILTNKINEAHKQMESAKSFLDLGALLLMRKQRIIDKNNDLKIEETNLSDNTSNPIFSTVMDSNPEILDEVFEEYIKEEYLKPLYKEEDDDLMSTQKMNQLLSKNYMQELKEVLVDKYKDMMKRESRALQRMYNRITNDESKTDGGLKSNIPDPPPFPDFDSKYKSASNDELKENENEYKLKSVAITSNKKTSIENTQEEKVHSVSLCRTNIFVPKKTIISVSNLPEDEQNEVTMKFSMGACLPEKPQVRFFNDEETFVGSGENSDEELVSNTSNECDL